MDWFNFLLGFMTAGLAPGPVSLPKPSAIWEEVRQATAVVLPQGEAGIARFDVAIEEARRGKGSDDANAFIAFSDGTPRFVTVGELRKATPAGDHRWHLPSGDDVAFE